MPNNKDKPATDTKNTRKRQREDGSQTDEDAPAGGHCCDASKMAEINAKLDKILQVMVEFDAVKTRVTQLEEETQHEIHNLRIFNSSVKNRKYKASSLRTSSAFRKDA